MSEQRVWDLPYGSLLQWPSQIQVFFFNATFLFVLLQELGDPEAAGLQVLLA